MSHCLACRRANQILGALTAPVRLYSQVEAPEWKQVTWACRTESHLDQAGVAVFVQDYLPIAAPGEHRVRDLSRARPDR